MENDAIWGRHVVAEAGQASGPVLNSGDLGPQPAAHGVMLFAQRLDGQASGVPLYRADVTLTAGNTACNFQCDWRGQFSAVFQRIDVAIVYQHPSVIDPTAYVLPTGRFKHGVMLGFGGWHAARPLTLTGRQQYIGAGASFVAPELARRFFPRLMRYGSKNWDVVGGITAETPLDPAAINTLELTIDDVYKGSLTEQIVREGIELGAGSLITITPRTAASGANHLVTPIYELGI